MPYFKWRGVDITGKAKKGYLPAYSQQELDEHLFRKGIALISCKNWYFPLLSRVITVKQKGALFMHVAQLLRAGLLLPQALKLAAEQSVNPFFHDIILHVSKDLCDGISFSDALSRHKEIADPFIITILCAGHEVGDSAQAFEYCAVHCKKQEEFEKSVRTSIAMPALTFLFFIGATLFIFIVIIPRFADMFVSLQHDLPFITRCMIDISNFVRSKLLLMTFIFFSVCFYSARMWSKGSGKKWYDRLLVSLPLFGVLIRYHHLQHVFRALTLLACGGTTLTKALALVVELEPNTFIQNQLRYMKHALSSGTLMSDAMESCGMFLPDVVAVVRVGQESGTMSQSFECAADIYRDRVDKMLRRVTLLIQPTIIVILGFLITLVIFSVYLPIVELSRIV